MEKTHAPQAKKIPKRLKLHGDTRTDEYSWLQEKLPSVLRHLHDENAYADASLAHTKRLQKVLYREMRRRIVENDMSVPITDGPYEYFTRTKRGKQYAIHYRRRGGAAEVLLDENALAKRKSFFSLGSFQVSPDHRYLAYSTDTNGSEKFTLYVKDLLTGKLLTDRLLCVGDVVWTKDSRSFFYTQEEHPYPPRRALLHRLGEKQKKDTLVYEDRDVQWYVSLSRSKDKQYVFIVSGNFDTTEVRIVPADAPSTPPILLMKRKPHVKYFPEHYKGSLYILTNERAVNFKIMKVAVSNPQKRNWTEWLAHNPKRALTGLAVYKNFLLITLREGGVEQAYTTQPSVPKLRPVRLPEKEHVIHIWNELPYESKCVRITYQSLIRPPTVFDYYPEAPRLAVRKRRMVRGWKPSAYISRRIWVQSDDVLVPVTIAYKAGARSRRAPLLLEAYGSYGISLDPTFSITKASLLKRGWAVAIAHPRGGGEMGWDWHKKAKLLTKHKTYRDVIAVADYLVARRLVERKRLALAGGSAGGMMVGAVLNMRPDLVGAAIAYVPAADTLTSSLDTSLGGTRLHYDETGDPRKPAHYRYLRKWSPYEAVRSAEYPALLVRASLNDIRTPYWEAAKWVARLRDHTRSQNPILFKVEMGAGHFGKSGRYEWVSERAFDFAFLFDRLQERP